MPQPRALVHIRASAPTKKRDVTTSASTNLCNMNNKVMEYCISSLFPSQPSQPRYLLGDVFQGSHTLFLLMFLGRFTRLEPYRLLVLRGGNPPQVLFGRLVISALFWVLCHLLIRLSNSTTMSSIYLMSRSAYYTPNYCIDLTSLAPFLHASATRNPLRW